MSGSQDVAVMYQELLSGIRATLGDELNSLYLHGAVAFDPAGEELGALDFHALVRRIRRLGRRSK